MANMRDLYMRSEDDPSFRPDQLEVSDTIESTVNKIKMTLGTAKGEVLGEPDFGLQLAQYLFDFDLNPFGLAGDANSQIYTYIPEANLRKIKVEPVYTTDSKDRKVYALKINIDGRLSPFAILFD
tara:strand:+ start:792 stop:1166 length:375 start_codon:yes stop_codon:yes gene_type:complete